MPTDRASVEGRAFLFADTRKPAGGSQSFARQGGLVGARHRPIGRGIALLTAVVLGLLPPLQAVSAAEAAGAHTRQQLAAAERAIPRQPRGLVAPHSEAVKEGMA